MQKEISDWFEQLSTSQNISSAAKVLAAALGYISHGNATGVFLLNEDKTRLCLFASWTKARGERCESFQPVSIKEKDDPLCFSLNQGIAYQADLNPTATTELVHPDPCNVLAFPLKSRESGTIGGAVVTTLYGHPIQDIGPLQIIGMYAASLIENMGLKSAESSIVGSLRDDIARLEKQRNQEQQLASTKIVGISEAMSHVRSLIVKAAPVNATVLITGETGTGKELTAEAIHMLSSRKEAPFLKINCGALSPNLLESELFGHAKGAFTGADADHKGLLRAADGGSVLLDEIGDMPLELQVKLLRVLQDQRVRPVGDSKEYPINIRVLAATNIDLQEAMKQGIFRKDLYHRLAALHIHIPPLRERRQDIPSLAVHFFEKLCRKHGREELSLPLEAIMHLSSRPLEGNARELANEIERTLLLADNTSGSLSFNSNGGDCDGQDGRKLDLGTMVAEFERDLINRSLRQNCGNIRKTAEALGLPRTTLRRKLEKGDYLYDCPELREHN